MSKIDYRPQWLVDSENRLNCSIGEHNAATARLDKISRDTENLGTMLLKFHPAQSHHSEANFQTRYRNTLESVVENRKEQAEISRCHMFLLDRDVFATLLGYLSIYEVVLLESTCSVIRKLSSESAYWLYVMRDSYSFVLEPNISECTESSRNFVLQRRKAEYQCLQFMKTMKKDRSCPRHKSIEPRRYTRSEKSVTHPMPVFERDKTDKIMSSADTLNKDLRSVALYALLDMCTLTSNCQDPIHKRLADDGAITVFISLLANEAGVVRELSCCVLANMLYWEAYHLQCHSTLPVNPSIRNQIDVCNGRRLLVGLLSSPTASVTLLTGQQYPSSATSSSSSSSSVQGMANKQASRTLLNLFSPSHSVPAPSTALVSVTAQNEYSIPFLSKHRSILPPISPASSSSYQHDDTRIPSAILEKGRSSTWEIAYYHKSGSIKDFCKVQILFSWNGCLVGRGTDDIGAFHLIGKPYLDIIGWSWILHKTYARDISTVSSVVDWMDAVSDDRYQINGESDISGIISRAHVGHMAYWTGGYCEVHAASACTLNSTMKTDPRCSHEGGAMEQYGYCVLCCSTVRTSSKPSSSDSGFYGVWETISSENHFELRKGGVFRMTMAK